MPVKRLALAKSRLSSYGDTARRSLALAFAADVVAAAVQAAGVSSVLVVTDDAAASEVLVRLGAQVVADDPDAGLNPALEHGAEMLRRRLPDLGVATLSADLPCLRPSELAAVLELVTPGSSGFVADHTGTGTTLLAAAGGAPLRPCYGPGSRAQHLASGAVELMGAPGLRHDVDTPADLEAAVALGTGPHTAAAVAALP